MKKTALLVALLVFAPISLVAAPVSAITNQELLEKLIAESPWNMQNYNRWDNGIEVVFVTYQLVFEQIGSQPTARITGNSHRNGSRANGDVKALVIMNDTVTFESQGGASYFPAQKSS